MSSRLAEEIPGGFKPDQYSNMNNPQAHYERTGPEIFEQTGGEIDAIVISVGTGGTISGVGRYFKEHEPDVLIVGADPEGSVYTASDDAGVHPYLVEGIGKDTWPKTMDPKVVDEWIRVSDRESFLWARRLAREEGILAGGSARHDVVRGACRSPSGSAPGKRVLMMVPDSGRNYLSKIYDDNWMLEHGFVERHLPLAVGRGGAAREARRRRAGTDHDLRAPEGRRGDRRHAAVRHLTGAGHPRRLVRLARRRDRLACRTAHCSSVCSRTPTSLHADVASAMQPPLAAVDATMTVDDVFSTLTGGTNAVVVAADGKPVGVLTRSDLLEFLAHRR